MDLKDLIAEYGKKNIRFIVPMQALSYQGLIPGIAFRVGDTPKDQVECEIVEDRYTVEDGYKITLQAVNRLKYGRDHYYQCDLASLLRRDPDFRMFVVTIDGYTELRLA